MSDRIGGHTGAANRHAIARTTITTAAGPRREEQGSASTFLQILSEKRGHGGAEGAGRVLGPAPPSGMTDRTRGSGMRVLAERALDAEKRVEALIASAGRGRTFSAGELIALQATVFRYSQTVEVLSRAADRLVGAVKQTLGTQV